MPDPTNTVMTTSQDIDPIYDASKDTDLTDDLQADGSLNVASADGWISILNANAGRSAFFIQNRPDSGSNILVGIRTSEAQVDPEDDVVVPILELEVGSATNTTYPARTLKGEIMVKSLSGTANIFYHELS